MGKRTPYSRGVEGDAPYDTNRVGRSSPAVAREDRFFAARFNFPLPFPAKLVYNALILSLIHI